jgi:tRNA pseudouridine38-40 synthase
LSKLKEYVAKFKGTHNFHNFTKKGNPKEKTNVRYLLDMGVERVSKEELESILGNPATNQYVRFKLHGQSFIYHQIRKMIGSMVQMFQDDQDASFLDNAFTFNKTPIWLAPSNGLLLDRVTSG